MKKNEVWEFDLRKTIRKYESSEDEIGYSDSRFYRKEKPTIALRDNGRVCRDYTTKSASLF